VHSSKLDFNSARSSADGAALGACPSFGAGRLAGVVLVGQNVPVAAERETYEIKTHDVALFVPEAAPSSSLFVSPTLFDVQKRGLTSTRPNSTRHQLPPRPSMADD
jgi:hypothetical protein